MSTETSIRNTTELTIAIVYHRADMDGVCSALIAAFYEERNFKAYVKDDRLYCHKVKLIGYDYTDSTMTLHKQLTSLGELEYIYMLDVTLPNELLDIYANKIIAIDHHDKAIERLESYKTSFKEYHCAIAHDQVYDIDGTVAKKAAACELTWIALFKDKKMPAVVRLCGRYDVWDHNKYTKEFNEYCRSVGIEGILQRTNMWDDTNSEVNYLSLEVSFVTNMFDGFNDAITDSKSYIDPDFSDQEFSHTSWLKKSIEIGTDLFRYKSIFNKMDSMAIAKTCMIKGTDIVAVVANQANRNSTFFDAVVDKKRHNCLIVFNYDISSASWKASFYTVDGGTDMQRIFDVILANPDNKVLSHGGHMRTACGFVTKDIQADLLDHLKFMD